MGNILDSMIDGTCCQECGEYIGEGDGFPRWCEDCEQADDDERGDVAPSHPMHSTARATRRKCAGHQFLEAAKLARERGLTLMQRSEQHYQLIGPGWLLDVYPGNHRLYRPQPGRLHPKRAPYLDVRLRDWTLLDVVEAAPAATGDRP